MTMANVKDNVLPFERLSGEMPLSASPPGKNYVEHSFDRTRDSFSPPDPLRKARYPDEISNKIFEHLRGRGKRSKTNDVEETFAHHPICISVTERECDSSFGLHSGRTMRLITTEE